MTEQKQKKSRARRNLLKSVVAGGGVLATGRLLPEGWSRPVVQSVILPAHAQTSPTGIGDFGAAVPVGIASNDRGRSILDFFVQPALAQGAAQVGNVSFDAFWTVRETAALICGAAFLGNVSTGLNGIVGRTGNSLDDFSRSVDGTELSFTNQQVSDSGVDFTASSGGVSGLFSAPPGGPGCGGLSKGTSSPYPDDEELV